MVGISASIDEDKKELAFELANILISEDVMTGINGDNPQYLLTSRRSVYDNLCTDYPIYGLLEEIVDSHDNHVFRLGAGAREYITNMEKELSERIALNR